MSRGCLLPWNRMNRRIQPTYVRSVRGL
jgi:hypothetical protein